MEADDDKPIAREPWQRLLRERYDAPPEVTDARIRAAARRALAPRPSRWWLPASLAASVLLAVMLVQWQYGDDRVPAYVTESDVAAPMSEAPPASDAPSADTAEAAGRAQEAWEAPAARSDVAVPSVPPPLVERPEYSAPSEPTREREAPSTAVTATGSLQDEPPSAPARAEAPRSLGKVSGLTESAAVPRDPAEWYREIEALRAEGRIEEAEAELARLEEAWPGWLEKNHPKNR
ncbi:MAG TPA: hypothetical protein VIK49_06840 [Steroidobacteraceae bacterium]